MGQTLPHGIYLPDEGERNCYAGLASNWQLLDGAVGTIAEHTTALAGKAPLVHTHTVSDITDFPAYGNAAGTICEGNDSRLSDARTPVAHTHGKADVTDLLNSNFIPSANNSYDLGSSSYQWNNLYAKNYYYNGTAWGLDKVNIWSKNNTYSADCIVYNSDNSGSTAGLKLRNSKAEVLSTGNTASDQSMTFRDKNDVAIGYIKGAVQSSSVALKIGAYAKDSSNNTVNTELQILAYANGNKAIIPSTTNAYDLGTFSYKWKTLNGVNPGALSLPNVRANVADPVDTVNWNLTGSRNKYTPTEDGWFYIRVAGTGSCAINIHNGDTDNSYPTWFNTSAGGYATLVVPCEKGISLYIYISATSIEYCSFRPCLGNV